MYQSHLIHYNRRYRKLPLADMSYFVLLDDAVVDCATLFSRYVNSEFLHANNITDLDGRLRQGWEKGQHAVLFADYEFGFELQSLPEQAGRLVLHWFEQKEKISDPMGWLQTREQAQLSGISTPIFQTGQVDYHRAITEIKSAIARGDCYQINYTNRLYFEAYGDPIRLYRRLRQPVPYAALASLPDKAGQAEWTLCFSPELFLRVEPDGSMMTEPMKGTAPASDNGEDAAAQVLRNDLKNRAENIMIVDLLRNDLGKIAKTGSVDVPEPFKVNRFGSVWQMTSAIYAQAKSGIGAADVLQAAFPCGSITGAPKRMSMQLIRQLESSTRGLYTGSIGHLQPCDSGLGFSGVLNVVIRTVQLRKKEEEAALWRGVYGVGSGIVWDSDAEAEYTECGWKARFLSDLRPECGIFETLRVEKRQCYLLERHLKRLQQSAAALNIPLDAKQAAEYFAAAIAAQPPQVRRLKISLAADGTFSHEAADSLPFNSPQQVIVAAESLPDRDYLRRFKTDHRAVYERGWRQAVALQAFDSLFFNRSGILLEGGRSNVFALINGCWQTPALDLDILNGVMRQDVMDNPKIYLSATKVVESHITLADLQNAEKIVLSNALRRVFEVRLNADQEQEAPV